MAVHMTPGTPVGLALMSLWQRNDLHMQYHAAGEVWKRNTAVLDKSMESRISLLCHRKRTQRFKETEHRQNNGPRSRLPTKKWTQSDVSAMRPNLNSFPKTRNNK